MFTAGLHSRVEPWLYLQTLSTGYTENVTSLTAAISELQYRDGVQGRGHVCGPQELTVTAIVSVHKRSRNTYNPSP